MRSGFKLLMLLCVIPVTTNAQNDQLPLLNIGDPAPPLSIRKWIKGTPVQEFEKGKVYVIEFWATWCQPCIAAMPHLSDLARQYKDRATIIGIDILENKTTSLKEVKAFVDKMGNRMDYHVAAQDSNFMETGWLDAFGEQGIPNSFVVNAEGRLAWIGHPNEIDEVLSKVVNNTWDMKEALAKRNFDRHLAKLDKEASFELNMYVGDAFKPGDLGKPDSALLMINEIIRKEPKLKYAPRIAFHTFSALLKTDPHKAYEYGREVLVTPTYEDPPYGLIIGAIKWYSDKLDIQPEIYELGAEAYQAIIDEYGKSGNINISKNYKNMADMHWRAKNKSNAISAMQKAIEALKEEKDFSMTDLAAFETPASAIQKHVTAVPMALSS